MRTLIYYSPDPGDACSFYRGLGPLTRLEGYRIKTLPNQVGWHTISDGDIGFLQRPYTSKHFEIAKLVKEQMPLWLDYDDHMFDIPIDNPGYETFMSDAAADNIKRCLELADVVTVATLALVDVFSEFTSNVKLIPNAYDDFRLPTNFFTGDTKPIVFWRGSDTHQRDLMQFKPQLLEVIKSNPEWTFMFVGALPWQLCHEADVTHVSGMPIFQYFTFLQALRPAITIVPLVDNVFNRAKSNIAWMEATTAGSVVLAPGFPGWELALTYEDPDDFGDRLNALCTHTSMAFNTVEPNQSNIKQHLLLSNINQLRLDILEELT